MVIVRSNSHAWRFVQYLHSQCCIVSALYGFLCTCAYIVVSRMLVYVDLILDNTGLRICHCLSTCRDELLYVHVSLSFTQQQYLKLCWEMYNKKSIGFLKIIYSTGMPSQFLFKIHFVGITSTTLNLGEPIKSFFFYYSHF